MRERKTDRMSQLPEFISHHIMSFLYSPKDRLRMSVLSKYWLRITASFPILDFDMHKFKGFNDHLETRENGNNCIDEFFKYVEYTTSRFCRHQNVTTAHTLKLIARLWDATHVDIVDECLELISIKGGVQVLVIEINGLELPAYHVSNKLFVSSASSLTSLTIHRCELPSSLMVEFKSLKQLKLELVPNLDDNMIKQLTTSCPLLEELILRYCHGIENLCLYGHENLQQVAFFFADGVERIDIEAPNLCFLTLSHLGGRASYLNVASCKKLTTVCYYGDPSPTSKGLADFSSSFPYLKTLLLDLPDRCDSLKLSSHSLTTFVLQSRNCDLEQLDIDIPNLFSFEYTLSSVCPIDVKSPFAVKRDSISTKSRMECHPSDYIDALWFKKLRRFLDKNAQFKELKLCLRAVFPFEVEELRMIQSSPFELDHVDLEPDLEPRFIKRRLSAYLAVVEGVLWCCRPRSLTLESGFSSIPFEDWSQIVKLTYEKLLIQEDQGQTNIHIVTSSASNAIEHFSNLTSLLTALPRDGLRPKITFIKEQGIVDMQTVVQEA